MYLHQLTITPRSPAGPSGFCGRMGALLTLALLGATAARADGPAPAPAGDQGGGVATLLRSPGRTGRPSEHVRFALQLGAFVIAGLATAHLVGAKRLTRGDSRRAHLAAVEPSFTSPPPEVPGPGRAPAGPRLRLRRLTDRKSVV